MHAIGASRAMIFKSAASEFFILGILSATTARYLLNFTFLCYFLSILRYHIFTQYTNTWTKLFACYYFYFCCWGTLYQEKYLCFTHDHFKRFLGLVHVKCLTNKQERWQSGRLRYLGKVVTGQLVPGFESPSLRQCSEINIY
jgi:hypothetical protein